MNSAVAIRLLLVEDDEVDANAVQRALAHSELDFTVAQVARMDEALAAVACCDYDAVLLDLGLPDGAGLGNLSLIQDAAPTFLSSY